MITNLSTIAVTIINYLRESMLGLLHVQNIMIFRENEHTSGICSQNSKICIILASDAKIAPNLLSLDLQLHIHQQDS